MEGGKRNGTKMEGEEKEKDGEKGGKRWRGEKEIGG